MKIVLHNDERVVDVIGGCQEIRVHGDRIRWEGGDLCAPFFLVPDEVDVHPEDPVDSVADHCRKQDWEPPDPQWMQELLERVEALEKGVEHGKSD
ncbi:hypothetical protein ACFQ49_15975 [Kroppenstedtia eburnea]|uniref:Uncharacterized protein n=1 Tax=Kroppenstedtia eburnea TaxID=714067 RepID=A0A1N7JEU8_9BACL|nr:hypothetical protein [Kroppenstedtia eburnea]QKI80611.1 hypothetical protein GXN75_00455 [Kroppenstedtia eburnea]SIS47883.1 hypothetical protein SAMN05421790_10210 [Kroppenstedtia eburnea]